MNKVLVIFLACVVALCSAAQDVPKPLQPIDLQGDWLGTINVGAVKLRVVFHLKSAANGLTGSMDSLDQNVKGIPASAVKLIGSTITIELPMGGFEGAIDSKLQTIDGNWSQGGSSLPLRLDRVKDPTTLELRRPQNPTKPYPYREEEVSYGNKQAGITLAGTLTLPQGGGPFPAALLITGSGTQDRDESIMGHRPFLVLADHLTRKGVAVLRVDDRGAGKSGGNPATATTADFATDVEAGIAYLNTRAEVDKKNIGLIGHSEGGVIAPMVAARNPDVAFVVLMAGSGVRGDEVIVAQTVAINKAGGASDEVVRKAESEEREVLSIVTSDPDNVSVEKKLRERMAGTVPENRMAMEIKVLTSPWYRYFLAYDPAPALAKVKCPVLAINGTKDLQIPPYVNMPAIRKALERGGNKDFETRELPGLNHLFQTAKTGLISEYGQIEETIAPFALEVISSWVSKHTSANKTAAPK